MYPKVSKEDRDNIIRWWNMRQTLGTIQDQARMRKLPVVVIENIIREEKERLRKAFDNGDLPERRRRRRV